MEKKEGRRLYQRESTFQRERRHDGSREIGEDEDSEKSNKDGDRSLNVEEPEEEEGRKKGGGGGGQAKNVEDETTRRRERTYHLHAGSSSFPSIPPRMPAAMRGPNALEMREPQ